MTFCYAFTRWKPNFRQGTHNTVSDRDSLMLISDLTNGTHRDVQTVGGLLFAVAGRACSAMAHWLANDGCTQKFNERGPPRPGFSLEHARVRMPFGLLILHQKRRRCSRRATNCHQTAFTAALPWGVSRPLDLAAPTWRL